MKKVIFYVIMGVLLFSCNGENVPDCIQNTGDIVRQEVSLPDFNTITVFENLNVVITEGEAQRIEIETGEFLLNEVFSEVEGERLILRNENTCNFVREFGITTIYITAPNITEIRSSTGGSITSNGTLGYESLSLISESFNNPETVTTDGSFDIELASESVSIVSNGIAFFQLTGTTINFNINVAAGDSRIEAENLIAENVNLNHRGSNDVFVNPQQSITGVVRGNGDVISSNRPPEIDVEELFNGRLIFRD